MSVPEKYKRIGDFHEYYSGQRKAPYLTIFIGGNHEASNYMSELYYGGWAAPNIYFMGAANVVRCGPLRIAGLSGIFKPYDYRKPHFERLPYNPEDVKTIYHTREIDVRKLLQLRTQVDFAISHDWPQAIEHFGDLNYLLAAKPLFYDDIRSNRLGSIAARHVLEKLRPYFWLSAHLHVPYYAEIYQGPYVPAPLEGAPPHHTQPSTANTQEVPVLPNQEEPVRHQAPVVTQPHKARQLPPQSASRTRGWNDFHLVAAKEDKDDNDKAQKDAADRQSRVDAGLVDNESQTQYHVTWKKVEVSDDFSRGLQGIQKFDAGKYRIPETDQEADGTVAETAAPQKPSVLEGNDSTVATEAPIENKSAPDVEVASNPVISRNPDEISLDSDEEGRDSSLQAKTNATFAATEPVTTDVAQNPDEIDLESGDGNTSTPAEAKPTAVTEPVIANVAQNPDEIDLDSDDESKGLTCENEPNVISTAEGPPQNPNEEKSDVVDDVSTNPALSTSPEINDEDDKREQNNGKPSDDVSGPTTSTDIRGSGVSEFQEEPLASPALPEDIINQVTRFYALDKCDRQRCCIHLQELPAFSSPDGFQEEGRPFQLRYDQEWLAITKALAPELQYGCDPSEKTPRNRGDVNYLPSIIEAEKWVEENVVKKNKMVIPQNFVQTAPVYDPSVPKSHDQPPEYNNPQTAAFCELLDIENKFASTTEEREAREAQGPRPSKPRFNNNRNNASRKSHGKGPGNSNRSHGQQPRMDQNYPKYTRNVRDLESWGRRA